jgi:hypothetical protein
MTDPDEEPAAAPDDESGDDLEYDEAHDTGDAQYAPGYPKDEPASED